MSATCRQCDSDLDAAGYCTSTEWCTYSDRLQQGSPPGPRTALDIARTAWENTSMQLGLFSDVSPQEYVRGRRIA